MWLWADEGLAVARKKECRVGDFHRVLKQDMTPSSDLRGYILSRYLPSIPDFLQAFL